MDEFVRSYIECALWICCGEDGNPLQDNYTINDIHSESLDKIKKECSLFIEGNKMDIEYVLNTGNRMWQLGHDFYRTRNNNGDFWYGEYDYQITERLTQSAKRFRNTFGESYLTDEYDGKIHVKYYGNRS